MPSKIWFSNHMGSLSQIVIQEGGQLGHHESTQVVNGAEESNLQFKIRIQDLID